MFGKKERFFYTLYIGCPIKKFLCLKDHPRESIEDMNFDFFKSVDRALKLIYWEYLRNSSMYSMIFLMMKIGQKSQKSDSNPYYTVKKN